MTKTRFSHLLGEQIWPHWVQCDQMFSVGSLLSILSDLPDFDSAVIFEGVFAIFQKTRVCRFLTKFTAMDRGIMRNPWWHSASCIQIFYPQAVVGGWMTWTLVYADTYPLHLPVIKFLFEIVGSWTIFGSVQLSPQQHPLRIYLDAEVRGFSVPFWPFVRISLISSATFFCL